MKDFTVPSDTSISAIPKMHVEGSPAHPRNRRWLPPVLTRFGSIANNTAGGSRPDGTEFWIFSCDSRSVFIRC